MKQKFKVVLLIDDDPATNFYNKKVIENGDCTEEVLVYDNAENALDYLKTSFTANHAGPGLIFLDLNMPYMNGWEFLEEYHRLEPCAKSDLLIVMLTTSLNKSDKQRALQLGVDGYALKPLSPKELQKLLHKKLPKEAARHN